MIFKFINKRIFHLLFNGINTYAEFNSRDSTTQSNQNFMVLPYADNITKVAELSLRNSNIRLGLRNLNRLNRFIKVHKDRVDREQCSGVVYKLQCNDCDASYVGQTKRQLLTRTEKHMSNIKLDPTKHSVVSNHIKLSNHSFDWSNVQILDSEPNYYKRITSEMIHIKEQRNGINSHTDTELLNSAYFNILNELAIFS